VPGGVLGVHRDLSDLLEGWLVDRVQDLDLLIAYFLGGEAHRGLHRHVAEQLEHVVLDQIAQCPGVVVVAGPAADADVLGGGDLHVIDVVAVHSGSNMPLAKRNAIMFWTVSLPR